VKLLVVEDNERVSAALSAALAQQGLEAVCVTTGQAAIDVLEQTDPDVVLLDLGLPDCDGFTVCSAIRARSSVPILVTTARSDYASCIRGLDLGADDYLIKPYNLAELLARVRAVIRRRAAMPAQPDSPSDDVLLAGPVRIDLRERVVFVRGAPTDLSDEEFGVLVALARRPGEVVPADHLVDEILRTLRSTLQASLQRYVASLHDRLGVPDLVKAVGEAGYRLSGNGTA
jgi:DNA-binding response OmpR family regulator